MALYGKNTCLVAHLKFTKNTCYPKYGQNSPCQDTCHLRYWLKFTMVRIHAIHGMTKIHLAKNTCHPCYGQNSSYMLYEYMLSMLWPIAQR